MAFIVDLGAWPAATIDRSIENVGARINGNRIEIRITSQPVLPSCIGEPKGGACVGLSLLCCRPAVFRCAPCDKLGFGEHGLLARKSRPLAETIFQHVWCARKVIAGKLPATPKAFGARAPQNCARLGIFRATIASAAFCCRPEKKPPRN